MTDPIYICGGDMTPGPRDECITSLHDYPLPAGYVNAHETAGRRLAKGWHSVRCPKCRIYGWVPGRPLGDGSDGPTLDGVTT
jgi:hypothetical protein